MTRSSRPSNKATPVAAVLRDHGSSMGRMLRQASLLMQVEQLIATRLGPDFDGQFQLAAFHGDRVVVVTPGATWATRLKMQAPELIESLHEAGFGDVRRIVVRVAPLVRQESTKRRKRKLSPAARQALDQMGRLISEED